MAFHVGQRDPNIPPPHLLDALRRARRPQFHDPCVKALLAQWKELGDPIEYVDLNQVAAILRAENPSATTRRKIVAAVEAAGIEIHNCDAWRQRLAKRRMHVQLTPEGQLKRIEEEVALAGEVGQRPTARQPRPRPARALEYILERERLKPGDEIQQWHEHEERRRRLNGTALGEARPP